MTSRFEYNFGPKRYKIADRHDILNVRFRGRFPQEFFENMETPGLKGPSCKDAFSTDFISEKGAALYLPEHYESKYAYPLILWFHDTGSDADELHSLMPRISDRNFMGFAFRGLQSVKQDGSGGFRWPTSENQLKGFLKKLRAGVCRLRRQYHIHSERIYLAGSGDGATMALRLLLARPEWFSGAISLGGRLPKTIAISAHDAEIQEKRIFLGNPTSSESDDESEAIQTEWLLRKAGMQVMVKNYASESKLAPEMLRELNRWMMDGIFSSV